MGNIDNCGLLLLSLLLAPAVSAAQQPIAGGYEVRQDTAVIARERFTLAGRVLRADVEVSGRGLMLETETRYDDAWTPERYRVRVRAGAGGPVLQELEATFADSVRWSATGAGVPQRGSAVLPQPATVLQNLVQSHLAAALWRYDRVAGGRQMLHAWRPDGGVVAPLYVTWSGERVRFESGSVVLDGIVGADGWLERLDVPSQRVRAVRRDDVAFAVRPDTGRVDTVPPPGIVEVPYEFSSGRLSIRGTVTLPGGGRPAVVALLVAGSGATDRNGNAPPVLRANLHAQLAWRLAQRGIATLRYDKRGVGASAAGEDQAMTTLDDFAEDVAAAVASLERDPRFRGVVVVGHSEGGWLAIRAAGRGAPALGVALLATPGRPLIELLRSQLAQQLDSTTMARFDDAMLAYLGGDVVVGLPPALEPLFRPVNRRFMESIASFDAVAELRRLATPVLIVQGDRDVQVAVADAERLAAAAAHGELAMVSGANHLFKHAEQADRVGQLALYADPTIPVVDEVVQVLAEWINRLQR